MAFAEGWSAINIEMPGRIPRTEYSAESHWPLLRAVTGTSVHKDSAAEEKAVAQRAFYRAWDYCMHWNIGVSGDIFGDCRTSMGHAVYVEGGSDFRNDMHSPFDNEEQVLNFDPFESLAAPCVNEIIARLNANYVRRLQRDPEAVHMTGIYVTAVSAMIDIFGWELLLTAAGTSPKRFGEMMGRYAKWVQPYFEAMAKTDIPVCMIHDDICWTSGAVFHPDFYRAYIFPAYKNYFSPLLDAGKRVLFTSDGDYTEFIDDIADAGVHGFALEPMTDLRLLAEKYGKTHAIIGNADTRILLFGSREDIEAEVKRCMEIGRDCPGFIMAVGNHIPANTPLESCLWYDECYRRLARR